MLWSAVHVASESSITGSSDLLSIKEHIMLEMGIVVALGLLVMLAKMPWKWKMRIISNPLIVDMSIFVVLTIVHWGTFTGVMVATVGALMCSVVLSIARRLVGYIESGVYIRGWTDVSTKL